MTTCYGWMLAVLVILFTMLVHERSAAVPTVYGYSEHAKDQR